MDLQLRDLQLRDLGTRDLQLRDLQDPTFDMGVNGFVTKPSDLPNARGSSTHSYDSNKCTFGLRRLHRQTKIEMESRGNRKVIQIHSFEENKIIKRANPEEAGED